MERRLAAIMAEARTDLGAYHQCRMI